jgi:uncharacterized protein (DUF169 family)
MADSTYDWKDIIQRLNRCLRLRTTPIGMKRFATIAEMEAVPKIRRPQGKKFTVCQLVGQAARLNFTVGFTNDDIYGVQCLTVLGMLERNDEFLSGKAFQGVWYSTLQDSACHQANMHCAPSCGCKAVALSPLENARLGVPDICMLYLNPGQMINFINGLQWKEYEVIDASVVGESSCADTWGKALKTGKPCVAIPCFAERRYGGVLDDEMLICLSAKDLVKGIEGAEALSKNGLRYPYAPYGIQNDCTEGMSISYK